MIIDTIDEFDKSLFLFLNGLGSKSWDGFWIFITGTKSGIPFFLLLLWYSYKHFGVKKTGIILLAVVVMIIISDQLSNVFKNILVRRLRPCHEDSLLNSMRLVKDYCGGQHGYFSAHASNSVTIATFFYRIFQKKEKWLVFLIIVWAALASYSRIYIGVHYPLDILTGICFGLLIGWLIYSIIKKKFVIFD